MTVSIHMHATIVSSEPVFSEDFLLGL